MWPLLFVLAALVAAAGVVVFIHGASQAESRRHTRLDIRVDRRDADRRDAA